MSTPALEVEGLSIGIDGPGGPLRLVEDVGLRVEQGEILALVGESGSGKSLTGLSILGLLAPPVHRIAGRIRLHGRDIATLGPRALRAIRGRDVAMIFQDPMTTLNPVMRIDRQMIEAIRVHDPQVTREEARLRVLDALVAVSIQGPEERLRAYPHQLSGGMRQRIVIATALLNRPGLIIADEPTTALDVTIQAQILHEIRTLARSLDGALVWITHDLAVVANLADRIAVLYAGRILEEGPADQVLAAPLHPYTRGLLDSVPALHARRPRLRSIAGLPPLAGGTRSGCRFAPRCPRRIAACAVEPPLEPVGTDRAVRCVNRLPHAAPA